MSGKGHRGGALPPCVVAKRVKAQTLADTLRKKVNTLLVDRCGVAVYRRLVVEKTGSEPNKELNFGLRRLMQRGDLRVPYCIGHGLGIGN